MTTSYRIVQLVKQSISNEYLKASDADVAKVLGVSRTAVSNYKGGRDTMSQATLQRVQEILKLPDLQLAELSLELQIEGTTSDGTRSMLTALRTVLQGVKDSTKTASVLLFALMAIGSGPDADASGNRGVSAQPSSIGSSRGLYIMLTRAWGSIRQAARDLAQLLTPPPPPPPFHFAAA